METRYFNAGDSEGNKEMVTRKLASFLVFSFSCYHIAVIDLLCLNAQHNSVGMPNNIIGSSLLCLMSCWRNRLWDANNVSFFDISCRESVLTNGPEISKASYR